VVAVGFDYTNGFHDAANAIATSVSTRALTPRTALVMAAVMNLIGAFLGTSVASTVGSGIIDPPTGISGLVVVLSALPLGRFGGLSPRVSTLLVAGIGFVSLYAVPFAVYPPNPPAVGAPETIGTRTVLYFTLVAISLVATVAAVLVGRRMAARWGAWYAGLAAVGGYLLIMLVSAGLLPGYNEVPADFPASVLYEFRTASFVTQLTLWAVLGVVLAELVHRLVRRSRPAAAEKPELAGLPG